MVLPNCAQALAFYAKAFDAETTQRIKGPNNQGVIHAEMRIGDSIIMMTDENPRWGAVSARALKASPISFYLYVADADAFYAQAVDAGCEAIFPLEDTYWGDRMGKVQDPFGYQWSIATRQEELSDLELRLRSDAFVVELSKKMG
ncbi:putative Glyoxalase/bleomycin resistance protein/dioxygenase [Magnetofaba australis IT-1]|uniref:Putative Glyoxalase/bleomycin resistance protein/dioxygenase n=2 Tax=Magnetofaba TaxID=1472292 RepID=A0A1Y2JZA4_9PROT|nr:putative Glyoxalase/bleomycin resistance protein/dioxygenase [Magnetofaba australis IT-1]